jgi:hypothetical protein
MQHMTYLELPVKEKALLIVKVLRPRIASNLQRTRQNGMRTGLWIVIGEVRNSSSERITLRPVWAKATRNIQHHDTTENWMIDGSQLLRTMGRADNLSADREGLRVLNRSSW